MKDKILLSKFIIKLRNEVNSFKKQGEDSPKTERLISQLECSLKQEGDFEFDLNDLLSLIEK